MTFDYAKTAGTVQRLLTRFGASATLTRTAATYDPETGVTTTGSATQNVKAAVFPIRDRYVDNTLIFATDQEAYLSASGVTEPKPGDVLTWNGVGLTVIRAKNLAPGQTAVLYELIVRA